jgi:hypothetical protein
VSVTAHVAIIILNSQELPDGSANDDRPSTFFDEIMRISVAMETERNASDAGRHRFIDRAWEGKEGARADQAIRLNCLLELLVPGRPEARHR